MCAHVLPWSERCSRFIAHSSTRQEAADNSSVEVDREANTLVLKDDRGQSSEFHFDRVYDQNATQDEIFHDAVTPIVDQVSRGMSCAVCC